MREHTSTRTAVSESPAADGWTTSTHLVIRVRVIRRHGASGGHYLMSEHAGKPGLRRTMLERVRACDPAERDNWDAEICRRVIGLPEYEMARQLLAYSPLREEVVLRLLIEHARAHGKHIYLPRVRADLSLEYRGWNGKAPLRRSTLGVLEPALGEEPASIPSLILVPAVACDHPGFRRGRGRGCFDRSLQALRALGPTVGVAYSCQLVDSIAREPHDVAVEIIVTEHRTMRVGRVVSD